MGAPTVTVIGEGGVVFEMDVPQGGNQLELFEQKIASGALRVLADSEDPGSAIDPAAATALVGIAPDPAPEPAPQLRDLTVVELRALADDAGIDTAGLRKADLVDALTNPASPDKDPETAPAPETPTVDDAKAAEVVEG